MYFLKKVFVNSSNIVGANWKSNQFSLKISCGGLGIWPLTYSFTCEFFSKFAGFVKKVGRGFYLLSKSLIAKSSHQEVFYENELLKKFAKFTGEHLRRSPFFK